MSDKELFKNFESLTTIENLEKAKNYADKMGYEIDSKTIGRRMKAVKNTEIRKQREQEITEMWKVLMNKLTEQGYKWDILSRGHLVVHDRNKKIIDFNGNCAEQNKVIKQYLESVGVEIC